MQIHLFDTPQQVGQAAAMLIAAQILQKPDSVLGGKKSDKPERTAGGEKSDK